MGAGVLHTKIRLSWSNQEAKKTDGTGPPVYNDELDSNEISGCYSRRFPLQQATVRCLYGKNGRNRSYWWRWGC